MLTEVIRLAKQMQLRMDGVVADLVFIGSMPFPLKGDSWRKPARSQEIEHMIELAEITTRRRV
jgi:hypothetical protein